MGNAVARDGDTIQQSIASGHINTKYWVSGTEYYSGYYQPSTKSATINGSVKKTSGTVYANSKLICAKDDNTQETDSYDLGSHVYVSNAHTNTTSGRITGGSSTVFVGGKAIARKSDNVNTHANTSTTINTGSSNVFAG